MPPLFSNGRASRSAGRKTPHFLYESPASIRSPCLHPKAFGPPNRTLQTFFPVIRASTPIEPVSERRTELGSVGGERTMNKTTPSTTAANSTTKRVRRRVVQLHPWMRPQPGIILGLVRGAVVQDDMQLARRMGRHHLLHEIQKLPPATPLIMPGLHLARGRGQRGKERAGAVPCVFMGEARQGPTVRQSQPALRPLQGLDARLLVHADPTPKKTLSPRWELTRDQPQPSRPCEDHYNR